MSGKKDIIKRVDACITQFALHRRTIENIANEMHNSMDKSEVAKRMELMDTYQGEIDAATKKLANCIVCAALAKSNPTREEAAEAVKYASKTLKVPQELLHSVLLDRLKGVNGEETASASTAAAPADIATPSDAQSVASSRKMLKRIGKRD